MSHDIISLFAAVIVLAGIAYAIAHGGDSAQLLRQIGDSFAQIIRAATGDAPQGGNA